MVGRTLYYFGDLNTNYDLSTPGWREAGYCPLQFQQPVVPEDVNTNYAKDGDDANSSNPFEKAGT